jgi:hypothetical protein
MATKWTCLLAVFLLHIAFLTKVNAFMDFSLRRALQNENATQCEPNADRTGITCTNVTLYRANISGEPLWIKLDLNQTYDQVAQITWTHIWAWFTFKEQIDVEWANVSFNSTTPNNTWIASATKFIGEVTIPTGNASLPNITFAANATFNVTLYKPGNADCLGYANGEFCDEGWLNSTLAVKGWGDGLFSESIRLNITLDQPQAGSASLAFETRINSTEYCANLSTHVTYADEYTFNVGFCPVDNSTNCTTILQTFNTSDWVSEPVVIADDLCFPPASG